MRTVTHTALALLFCAPVLTAQKYRDESAAIVVRYDASAIRLHPYLVSRLIPRNTGEALGIEGLVHASVKELPGHPVEQPPGVFVCVLRLDVVASMPAEQVPAARAAVVALLEKRLSERLGRGVRERLEQKVAQLAAEADAIGEREDELRTSQRSADEAAEKMERLEQHYVGVMMTMERRKAELHSQRAGVALLEQQLSELEARVAEARMVRQETSSQCAAGEQKTADLRAELQRASGESERARELRAGLRILENELSARRARLQDVLALLQALANQSEALTVDLQKARVEVARSEAQLERTQRDIDTLNARGEELREAREKAGAMDRARAGLESQLAARRERLARAQAELESYAPVTVEIW